MTRTFFPLTIGRGVMRPRLTPCHIFLFFLSLICNFSLLHADTTWVAGEVYGTWTREGNPYLVTDTLIVPLDSTLRIHPGVQIWFLDQEIRRTPIWVYGRLRAIGAEGDSIYFYSPVRGFGGIDNQNTGGTEIRLEYCVIDSISDDIESHEGHTVIEHSRIRGAAAISLYEEADSISFCDLGGPVVNMLFGGPGVFQHNQGKGINASYQQMQPIFDNQIYALSLDFCSWVEVYDNEFQGCGISNTDCSLHNNRIEHMFWIDYSNITVEDNQIGAIDSLEFNEIRFIGCQGVIRRNQICGYLQDYSSVSILYYRNMITSPYWGILISSGGECLIQGNTINFDGYGIWVQALTAEIVDNILLGSGFNDYGVYASSTTSYDIRYNDFYDVTTPTYECELDTGNIWLDPQFQGGDPFDYNLQASSPCIDAGDPASPLDPDGTRADMGALYFDHRLDHPPALYSPMETTVQIGTEFRYVARATDDYGPLQFGFWNLPSWLIIENLDWVADSAVVSGLVPLDQEDFTFGVWVEDGAAQRDSQEVSVVTSQYTILAGVLTGVLTAEESPYLVVDDLVVPAADSLRIEPGVEIRFRRDAFPWQPNLIVRGTLHAVGTLEDTIRFLPEYEDSTGTMWGGIWFRGYSTDTSRIEYACFFAPYYAIEADSQASILLRHVVIDAWSGVRVLNSSWAGIDSCFFRPFTVSVFVRDSRADITNCYSLCSGGFPPGMHVDFCSNARGTVQKCTFVNG